MTLFRTRLFQSLVYFHHSLWHEYFKWKGGFPWTLSTPVVCQLEQHQVLENFHVFLGFFIHFARVYIRLWWGVLQNALKVDRQLIPLASLQCPNLSSTKVKAKATLRLKQWGIMRRCRKFCVLPFKNHVQKGYSTEWLTEPSPFPRPPVLRIARHARRHLARQPGSAILESTMRKQHRRSYEHGTMDKHRWTQWFCTIRFLQICLFWKHPKKSKFCRFVLFSNPGSEPGEWAELCCPLSLFCQQRKMSSPPPRAKHIHAELG